MGLICIFIGIVFLSNPAFRMLDYMPDLFGCILIIIGTTKLSYIDYRIEKARKYAGYFAFISAIKIPLSMYVSVREKGYLLPATFAYSVLEAILMTGMLISLIGGLQYLTARENCEEKNFRNSENASVICFIFSVARAVISFIPELFSLGTQKDSFDYTFHATPEQNAALLKPYAELLAFAVIFVFGLYFLFVCGKYFIGLARDKQFCVELKKRYETYVAENTDKVNHRRVKCTLLILLFALLCLYNQIIDYVNVIPNTLSYIFMLAASIYMIRVLGCKNLKPTLAIYIPLTALSVYNGIVQYKLLSETKIDFLHTQMFVKRVPDELCTTDTLPGIILPVIAEYILIAVLIFTLIRSLENLPFLREKDSVSIFNILFGITASAYLVSCAYIYFGQYLRTAYTYATKALEVYLRYDSILVMFEWIALGSFILMLYFAYKYGSDLLNRVNPKKQDLQQ